jgi:uncharacterized membrane protein YidH (DUF202 family)
MDVPRLLLAAAVRRMPSDRREWGAAMLAELAQLQNTSTRWRFALGCARVALFPPRNGGLMNNIKNIGTDHRAAALIGFLLALPLSLVLLIARFEIEPLQGFLEYLFSEANSPRKNTFGTIFILGSALLLPVALIITLRPVVRSVRAGKGIGANPVNLLLAVALLAFITAIVGGFIVDQYPCWIGVPNCD